MVPWRGASRLAEAPAQDCCARCSHQGACPADLVHCLWAQAGPFVWVFVVTFERGPGALSRADAPLPCVHAGVCRSLSAHVKARADVFVAAAARRAVCRTSAPPQQRLVGLRPASRTVAQEAEAASKFWRRAHVAPRTSTCWRRPVLPGAMPERLRWAAVPQPTCAWPWMAARVLHGTGSAPTHDAELAMPTLLLPC